MSGYVGSLTADLFWNCLGLVNCARTAVIVLKYENLYRLNFFGNVIDKRDFR